MPEVVLIRAGSTDFDDQNRIQGRLDLPLSPRGEREVQQLVDQLRDVSLEVLYTAPSDPARATAVVIGSRLNIPVKELPNLQNLDQGLWQGLCVDEITRKHPKVYKQWRESPETVCPPEGETVSEALTRIRKVLQKPLKRKDRFGVVASDPLVTLIRCLVAGRMSEIPTMLSECSDNSPVDVLHVSRDVLTQNAVVAAAQTENIETAETSQPAALRGDKS